MTVMAALMYAFRARRRGAVPRRHAGQRSGYFAGVSFLLVAALFQVVDGAQVVGAGMLRGLHDARVPMVFALFGSWAIGLGVGVALAFSMNWRGIGIWVGLAAGLGVVAVLMIWAMVAAGGLGFIHAVA